MNCTRCKLYKNVKGEKVESFLGNPNARFVFVGELYSANKKDMSVDTIGIIFSDLLEESKIDKNDIALINIQHCWVKDGPKTSKKDLDACFFNLHQKINEIKPELVIALGNNALYQTLGVDGGIEKYRGKIIESSKMGGFKVLPMLHFGSVKYDDSRYKIIKKDFQNILNILNDKPFEIKHYPYIYITTYKEMVTAYQDIIGKETKFDIETTGLNPYKDQINLVQLSAEQDKIYIIDMRVIDKKEEVIELFREIMNINPITGQDFSFDSKFFAVQYNAYPKIWSFDTCLGEYSITGLKDNDLTSLTDKYAPESSGYDDEVKKAGGAHKVMEKEKLLQYSANDIGVMYPIQRKQTRALMKRKCMWNNGFTAEWCYKNLTLSCNNVLTKMSIRGIRYDVEKLKIVDEKYKRRAKRALMKAQALDGVKACEKHFRQQFNPRSPQQIKWMMIEYYKLPILATTQKDQPSIGKTEMKLYAEEYDNKYAKIMEKYRSLQNIRDNFLGGVIPKLEGNIAHPNYSLHGTASGRPISKNPNCFSEDTEILTNKGWVLFKHLTADMQIGQYDYSTKAISFDKPIAYIKYKYNGDLVNIVGAQHIDLLCTKDHRCLLQNRKTGKFNFTIADNYWKDAKQIQAGYYRNGNVQENRDKLILLFAFQADGYRDKKSGYVEFSFSKKRKIDRLRHSLINLSIPFNERPKKQKNGKDQTRFYIAKKNVPDWFSKKLNIEYFLSLPEEDLKFCADECFRWDGTASRLNHYSSNIKRNVDIIQILQLLVGRRGTIGEYIMPSGNSNWYICKTNKDYSLTANHKKEYMEYNGFVYCVSMPKGTVIVRRNNKVAITGNCLNYPNIEDIRSAVVADVDKNYCLLYSDLSQIEVRIASVIYYDENLLKFCNDTKKDFHCQTTAKSFGYDYNEVFKWHNAYEDGSRDPKAIKMHEARRAAKCVPAGTRLFTDKGLKKIEDFFPKDIKNDTTYEIKKDIYTSSIDKNPKLDRLYKGIKDYTIKIETEDGYYIEASKEHKIRVLENGKIIWKEFDKLTKNDYIALNKGSRLWNNRFKIPTIDLSRKGQCYFPWNPNKKDKIKLAQFLGLMLSEGSYNKKHKIIQLGVSKIDSFKKDIKNLLENLFDNHTIGGGEHTWGGDIPVKDFRVSCIDAVLWLDKLEIGTNAGNKKIPECVFSWPKKYQVELLKWYFEGDGSIKKNGNGYSINCCSKSEQLIDDLMLLLLNFGILSHKSSETRKGYPDEYYYLDLKGNKSRCIFMKEIGFVTTNKSLKNIDNAKYKRDDANIIPNCVNVLKTIKPYVKGGIGRNKLRECLRENNAIRLNKERCKLIVKNIDKTKIFEEHMSYVNVLEQLSKINVSWQKINSISVSKEKKELFDVTVPKPHEVTYNGFICHQSITFGVLYQMGVKKLSYELGITEEEAKIYIDNYFKGFPGLKKKIEWVKEFVNKHGYIDTWFGFRRHWEFYGEEEFKAQREAVNHPVQGTAWNLVEMIIIKVEDFLTKYKFKSQLIWQNYDSIAIHTYEPEKMDVANEVKRIMETSHKEFPQIQDVDIPTDIKVGLNLSDLKKLV